jgi:hypothetical protein
MMMQRSDCLQERFPQPRTDVTLPGNRYYVELPFGALDEQGRLLDSVICFTFDTLNVQHLDLRIVAEAH